MQLISSPFRLAVLSGMLLLCASTLHASRDMSDEKEPQIRAAFLLNFMKFTTWPDRAFDDEDSPLVLTVIGEDPFGRVLERTFARERVRGRSIKIRRVELPDRDALRSGDAYERAVDRLRGIAERSHVIYLSECDTGELDLVLDGSDLSTTLTVGDRQRCAENGTALALDRDGDRIVFYANVREIDETDLKVSSQLLSLARIMKPRKSARREGGR